MRTRAMPLLFGRGPAALGAQGPVLGPVEQKRRRVIRLRREEGREWVRGFGPIREEDIRSQALLMAGG